MGNWAPAYRATSIHGFLENTLVHTMIARLISIVASRVDNGGVKPYARVYKVACMEDPFRLPDLTSFIFFTTCQPELLTTQELQ